MPFSGCSALCEVNSQLKKKFFEKDFVSDISRNYIVLSGGTLYGMK